MPNKIALKRVVTLQSLAAVETKGAVLAQGIPCMVRDPVDVWRHVQLAATASLVAKIVVVVQKRVAQSLHALNVRRFNFGLCAAVLLPSVKEEKQTYLVDNLVDGLERGPRAFHVLRASAAL